MLRRWLSSSANGGRALSCNSRCHRQRRLPQLVGIEMWRGSPCAEFGVLKRIFEFLGSFGCQFQDWMILV